MKYFKLLHWNFKQVLISLDQVLRCLLALFFCLFCAKSKAYADETMSAWCYRLNYTWYGHVCEFIVNCIMYVPERVFYKHKWGHCYRAYLAEIDRAHSPK